MKRTLLGSFAVVLAFVGLVLTSCTQTPLEPQEAAFLAVERGGYQTSDAEVSQSVSGNAHLRNDPVGRTVTFEIRKHADGSVTGWYHASARGPGGADVRVCVECLHVIGNQAWAGGTIVSAVNPDNIGRPVSMRFIDNGEGASAPPDEFGGIWEYHDCATEPGLSTRQLTIGNLQIRG
jgi:hypothetical protein